MYNRVSNPTIDIYDGETDKYLGKARFDMTRAVEKVLLDWANFYKTPTSLVLSNFEVYEPAADYIPPSSNQLYKRKGILRALFTSDLSKGQEPVEITFTYDALVRFIPYDNRFITGSIEFRNIQTHSIETGGNIRSNN